MKLGRSPRKSAAKARGRTKSRAMTSGGDMTGGIVVAGRLTVAAAGMSGGAMRMDHGKRSQIMTGQIMPTGKMIMAMPRSLLMNGEMPS